MNECECVGSILCQPHAYWEHSRELEFSAKCMVHGEHLIISWNSEVV